MQFQGRRPRTNRPTLNPTSGLHSAMAGAQAPRVPQGPRDRMNVRVAFDLPGSCDLHQQLAEVLALEQAEERGRRVLQALDHVLAVLHAAAAHPFAHLAQEIRLPGGEIPDNEPRSVRRLRSTENMSGPAIGVVARPRRSRSAKLCAASRAAGSSLERIVR
jgi:hypothetical protein